jgi:DNA-binding NarL/FixJ family response regulator
VILLKLLVAMKTTIAIADDHPVVINGLYHILSDCTDIEITASYTNGKELLYGLKKSLPDILLLDIQMPGQTGDELAEIISECYPEVKMLVLTNYDNLYYIKTMFRKGVRGYLLKTTQNDKLLDAIRALYRGEQYLEPLLKEKLMQEMMQVKKQMSVGPILSRREKEVLQYIATDLTSRQIADRLYVSKRTIDNHRLSLLMKLGVKNVAALVKKAIQLSLID